MKEIQLTQGKIALVDDEDFDLINSFHWRYAIINGKTYAQQIKCPSPQQLMHRLILGAIPGQFVDHINGNGLDNRRSNLRFCTHMENMRNRKKSKNGTSQYKGVYLEHGKWRARIMAGFRKSLGLFTNEKEAAMAYDIAAKSLHGHFARLNFPGSAQ